MAYFPVGLALKNKKCVVIGGGSVAQRKVETLLAYEAEVTVISPEITPTLEQFKQEGKIKHFSRTYKDGDVQNAFLVIGATKVPQVNLGVYKEASSHQVLVNIVDQPSLCNFIVPSILRRGELTISISTSGSFPALAKKIRKDLEALFGPEYEPYLHLLKKARAKIMKEYSDPKIRKQKINQVLNSDILNLIQAGKMSFAEEKINSWI